MKSLEMSHSPGHTLFVLSNVGPPEFPGLIAASIWMIGRRPGLFLVARRPVSSRETPRKVEQTRVKENKPYIEKRNIVINNNKYIIYILYNARIVHK